MDGKSFLAEHDLCDIQEASEITGWAVETLYKKTSGRQIGFYKIGNRVFFSRRKLRAAMNAQLREVTPVAS